MGSKVFLILGLSVAIVLLISSEVAAKDLAENSNDDDKNDVAGEKNGVDDAKHGGGYPGGGRGGYGGGHCRYGCCGRSGYYGRGCRCCSYAGEAVDAQTEAQPQN